MTYTTVSALVDCGVSADNLEDRYIDKALAEVEEPETLVGLFGLRTVLDEAVVPVLEARLRDDNRVEVDWRVLDGLKANRVVDDLDEVDRIMVEG